MHLFQQQVLEVGSRIFEELDHVFYWPVPAEEPWATNVKKQRERAFKKQDCEWLYVPTGMIRHYFTSGVLYQRAPIRPWRLSVEEARALLVEMLEPFRVTHKPGARRGSPWRFAEPTSRGGGFKFGNPLWIGKVSLDDEVWDRFAGATEATYGFRYERGSSPAVGFTDPKWQPVWKAMFGKAREQVARDAGLQEVGEFGGLAAVS